MRFFKSDEEKLIEYEDEILNEKEYIGLVGSSHAGYDFIDGFRNSDKIKFKKTAFKLYDDRIMIERHRKFINLSDIKDIFQKKDDEVLLILNNEDIIPITPVNGFKNEFIEFKAFINILNNLIEENKSNKYNMDKHDVNGMLDDSFSSELNNKLNEKPEDEVDRLIELGKMYEKGLLTDEEFTAMKKKLINGD